MTGIYKILNDTAPRIVKSLFQFHINQYNLGKFQELSREKIKTVNYRLETWTYRAPAIWAKLRSKYVHATSLDEFKSKIKSWKCEICPWSLCKNYQPNHGYIN